MSKRKKQGALLRKYDAIGTKGPNLRACRRLSSEMNTMILLSEPLLTLKSVRGGCNPGVAWSQSQSAG